MTATYSTGPLGSVEMDQFILDSSPNHQVLYWNFSRDVLLTESKSQTQRPQEANMNKDNDQKNEQDEIEQGRREFLKGGVAAAGAGLAARAVPGLAVAAAA